MMFELDSFNLINKFERASNEPNAEQLASSSARLQPYICVPYIRKIFFLNLIVLPIKQILSWTNIPQNFLVDAYLRSHSF